MAYMTKTIVSMIPDYWKLTEIQDEKVNKECAMLEAQGFEVCDCKVSVTQTGNQYLYMYTTICYHPAMDISKSHLKKISEY